MLRPSIKTRLINLNVRKHYFALHRKPKLELLRMHSVKVKQRCVQRLMLSRLPRNGNLKKWNKDWQTKKNRLRELPNLRWKERKLRSKSVSKSLNKMKKNARLLSKRSVI